MMAEDLLGVNSGKPVDVNTYHVATTLIGGGRFASVYRAYDKKSMADVALKIYLSADERAHLAATAEKDILKRLSDLNTPFFPTFKGAQKVRLKDGWHPVLVMELGEYVEGQPKRPGEAPDRSIISLAQVMPEAQRTSPQRWTCPSSGDPNTCITGSQIFAGQSKPSTATRSCIAI